MKFLKHYLQLSPQFEKQNLINDNSWASSTTIHIPGLIFAETFHTERKFFLGEHTFKQKEYSAWRLNPEALKYF